MSATRINELERIGELSRNRKRQIEEFKERNRHKREKT